MIRVTLRDPESWHSRKNMSNIAPAALRAGVCVHEKGRPQALLLAGVERGISRQILGLSSLLHSHGALYYILQPNGNYTDPVKQRSSGSVLLTFVAG